MASASTDTQRGLPPTFFLTPEQRNLLFAALNTNGQKSSEPPASTSEDTTTSLGPDNDHAQEESLFVDGYDYDFIGEPIDFDNAVDTSIIEDLDFPGESSTRSESAEADVKETKRSHPSDEDDDGATEGNGGEKSAKRRESLEKVPKKPGRKPLTSEPTTKRKAQNRAAQRAFRERKEKHLKDMEVKIDELKKQSDDASHENNVLRTQVKEMTAELNEYKRRLSLISNQRPVFRSGTGHGAFGPVALNDVNFQFEFPQFGTLPGPPPAGSTGTKPSVSMSPLQIQKETANKSPASGLLATPGGLPISDIPVGLTSSSSSSVYPLTAGLLGTASMGGNTAGATVGSSPSTSSNSNQSSISSCGTSPSSSTQSPQSFKPAESMAAIDEEIPRPETMHAPGHFSAVDFNSPSFDWLTQQNGGQFEPQLEDTYRDTISETGLFDTFLNEALDVDFSTPYFTAPTLQAPTVQSPILQVHPKDNVDEIKAKLIGRFKKNDGAPICATTRKYMRAHGKASIDEQDIDHLCSELAQKATCGAMV